MYRALTKLLAILGLALIIGVGGVWWWYSSSDQRTIARLHEQQKQLEEQKRQLEQVVARLGADKRVADIIVTDRRQEGSDVLTSLLFVEYDRAGQPMTPRQFVIQGDMAHVEAMVIEFPRDQVIADDPLRGHAIALFTRIFGEHESPVSASRIDSPGKVPAFYQNTDPKTAAFERKLWETFWKLENDEALRKEMGVRIAVGKGVWGPFAPETLYTITLTPDGNLSRSAEPMRGVYHTYIQMLKQKTAGAGE